MSPDVGSTRSATRRIRVVLPQPEGPMRLTKSPWATSRFASSSATASPLPTRKTMPTSRMEMIGPPWGRSPPLVLGSVTEGFAPDQSSATRFAYELAVPDSDLSPHRHDARPPVDLHALEGAVVDVHLVCRGADLSPVVRVVDHQVGVRSHGDGALAREEPEELGGVGRRHLNEALETEVAAAHAVRVKQVHAVLDRRHAVGDASERLPAHRLLLHV